MSNKIKKYHQPTINKQRRGLEEWLKDPQAVKLEARMPKFKFKDWEFEALTNYLMTLRRDSFLQIKRSE